MIAQSYRERLFSLEKELLDHFQLDAALAAIDELRERFSPIPNAKLQARALFIVGYSGAGKSTVLEKYMASELGKEGSFSSDEDGDMKPVVLLELPNRPQKRQFVSALIGALGYKPQADIDSYGIVLEIADLCRRLGVQVILMDEAHELTKGGGKRVEGIQEFFKSLLNHIGAQFVLAGQPNVLDLHDEEQVDRRMTPTIYLTPYEWKTAVGRVEFLALLTQLEGKVGVPFVPSISADPLLSAQMFYATKGRIGLVSRFMSVAMSYARANDLEKITPQDLACIFHSLRPRKEMPKIAPVEFDAPPVDEPVKTVPAAGNPFLADTAEFRKMWNDWLAEGEDGSKDEAEADADGAAKKKRRSH